MCGLRSLPDTKHRKVLHYLCVYTGSKPGHDRAGNRKSKSSREDAFKKACLKLDNLPGTLARPLANLWSKDAARSNPRAHASVLQSQPIASRTRFTRVSTPSARPNPGFKAQLKTLWFNREVEADSYAGWRT